jgi:hypothetical protein
LFEKRNCKRAYIGDSLRSRTAKMHDKEIEQKINIFFIQLVSDKFVLHRWK